MGPHARWVVYHRGSATPTMYIYSLGHFLSTKGALIDGDGYPPKNPKNDPKKVTKMTKIWSNLRWKKCQKQWFLMAKSSFSLFFIQLTQKWPKIDQKLTTNWGVKMRSNLTTKKGDSGSAGLLEIKCVIIEALNLDTKSDQIWCQQQKTTKNDQKSSKQENAENEKNTKTWKTTKIRKCKSEKITKSENAKTWKMMKKVTPPQNGQNVR